MHELLAEFLEWNPEAELRRDEKHWTIVKPWGDDTICVRIGEEDCDLVADLNSLRLPPRLTAILHKGSKDLEIIYTPFPPDKDLRDRSFDFSHGGVVYRCEFAAGSQQLERIALACRFPSPPSETDYRNLQIIQWVLRVGRKEKKQFQLTSFWIRTVELDEYELLQMLRHLNFYMAYYDRETPTVLIHEDSLRSSQIQGVCRYPFGPFPPSIVSRRVDSHLLSLADEARKANPRLAFIFYYQVLEYVAFYHVRDEVHRRIQQAIMRPDVQARIDEVVQDVAEAIAESTMHDYEKIELVMRQMPPLPVWEAVAPHLERFCEPTVFDGGFRLEPVIRRETTGSEFKVSESFARPLRDLRNALVHGRESRMSAVIEPSKANDERLRPWLAPLAVVALQAIQYLS